MNALQRPMLCEICGTADAVIQLTTVVDNENKVKQLCRACAAERGVDVPPAGNLPLADFLAQIGSGILDDAPPVSRCPSCGLTPTQLKQTGRLGCSECYTHFDKHLRGLLRRLHGGTQHVGKVAVPPDDGSYDRKTRVEGLRRNLQRAVDSEDFEHAAALRDEIRRMETAE